jgi:nucleotide-binding universal stress UspA family protein
MTYKTILVHCDAGKGAPARLRLAAELAERYQVHLVGLQARPSFEPPIYDTGAFTMNFLVRDDEEALAASEAASSKAFADAIKGKSVSSEWRSVSGHTEELVALHARYADMTVVGQNDPQAEPPLPPPPDLRESVVLATGRGVLVVPHTGAAAVFGRDVMLCWNASREAARAAAEALPLLQSASSVTVLVVELRFPVPATAQSPGGCRDLAQSPCSQGGRAARRRR